MRYYYNNELYHHGIKGQKWGVRRYRNEDGTLTTLGKNRERKLQKLNGELNDLSARSKSLEKDLANKRKEYEKYSNESREYKPRNLLMRVGRVLTKANMRRQIRDLETVKKYSVDRKMNRIFRKVGRMPYAETKVYLGDVWNLPYDVYEIRLRENERNA